MLIMARNPKSGLSNDRLVEFILSFVTRQHGDSILTNI
jgi:hypothetical protein